MKERRFAIISTLRELDDAARYMTRIYIYVCNLNAAFLRQDLAAESFLSDANNCVETRRKFQV